VPKLPRGRPHHRDHLHGRVDAGPIGKLKAAARALFRKPPKQPKQSELAAIGLTAEDLEEPGGAFALWPDNADAFNVMQVLSGQWRIGPGGPIGLDYNVLEIGFRHARIPRRARRDVFRDLQVMEEEALKVIHDS
jgi:hypothetical protein